MHTRALCLPVLACLLPLCAVEVSARFGEVEWSFCPSVDRGPADLTTRRQRWRQSPVSAACGPLAERMTRVVLLTGVWLATGVHGRAGCCRKLVDKQRKNPYAKCPAAH